MLANQKFEVISMSSSENYSEQKNANNNEIYIHNERIENLKNSNSNSHKKSSSENVKSESGNIIQSEESEKQKNSEKSEESFDNKSNSSSSKKREENRKIYNSTERILIRHRNYSESDNSSNKSDNKKRFLNEVGSMISSSMKRSFRSDSESSYNDKNYDYDIKDDCPVCGEKLTQEEMKDNYIKCGHMFCNNCYYEFIKEKINSNFIEGIKCLEKDCDARLYDDFIKKKIKLKEDQPLLKKYEKLNLKRQLMLDPNIQLCPFPDCDSYAKKRGKIKFVSCMKGHKFCFNCLKEWHENKECDTSVDKSFENWRDSYKVKRCPKCKYFIEKNEGCNHITCYNCKYQFCWLCLGEYTSDHYDFGRCTGLQFTDCSLCSNRIFNFLYQLLLVFAKCLLFGIGLPFICVFALGYVIGEKINYDIDCLLILSGILGCTSCLSFIMCIIPLTSFIALLMLFYWPLQDKIFGLFNQC